MRPFAVFGCVLGLLLAAPGAPAQETARATLHEAGLTRTNAHRPWLLEGEWLARPGDERAWAAPELDDAGWEAADVALPDGGARLAELAGGRLPEVAWFRLHLEVDSSLHGRTVGVRLARQAAAPAQLYLDGALLFDGWGEAGGRLPLGGDYREIALAAGDHVLALRVSLADAPRPALGALPDGRVGAGVAMVGAAAAGEGARLGWAVSSAGHYLFFAGALLAFGVLHLALFLYFARPRSNLYFALFATSWAVHTLVAFGVEFTTNPARFGLLSDAVTFATLPLTYVTGLLTMHSLVGRERPKHFRWALGLVAAAPVAAAVGLERVHPALHLAAIVVAASVVVPGIRQREAGARGVGIGFLVLLASVVGFDLLPTLGVLPPTLHFGTWYGSVALLLATSVRLARTYARSSGGWEQATRALVDANRTLEQRVEERTGELAASEEKFRSLVQGANDAIVLFDADTLEIQEANPAAEALLGVDRDALIGVPLPRFCAMEELDHCLCELREQARKTATLRRDFTLRRVDGRRVPIELSASTVEVDGRDVVQGIMHDLTERARAEAALREAKEIAETANATKSQFLASMSHELRTPLNAILGYSEMLLEEAEESGQPRMASDLGKVNAAGKHLLGLINTVLDISKVEAGKMDLNLSEIPVRALALEVGATIRPLVERQGTTLVVDVTPDAGDIRADETKVRQILLNLLGNAAKFTEGGSIRLTARREEADGEGWVVFDVADSGIGMTPDQLERLFEPFVQADATISGRFGGTGLGLTLTKRFAELMNGSVSVASEAGVGSCFTVRLPAAVPPVPRSLEVPPRLGGAAVPVA